MKQEYRREHFRAQDANSSATSAPGVQSNVNAPVRVASNGSDGDVNQSNSSSANSEAENNNTSTQGIDQGQSSTQGQSSDSEASGCCNGSSNDPSQTQRSNQKQKANTLLDQIAN